MLRYVFRRLLTAIPTLFVIVTISFFLIRVAPGGPFNQEKGLNPVIKANLERVYSVSIEPLVEAVSALSRQSAARRFRPELQSAGLHRRRTVQGGTAGVDPDRRHRADPRALAWRRPRHHRRSQPEQGRRLCRDRHRDRRQHHTDLRDRAAVSTAVRADAGPRAGRRAGPAGPSSTRSARSSRWPCRRSPSSRGLCADR